MSPTSVAHTLLLLIRADRRDADLAMARVCLSSLGAAGAERLVVANQGCLDNDELASLLARCRLTATVVGEGCNVGIAAARQACFAEVWRRWPDVEFVSELHLDMVVPPGWTSPLVQFLAATDHPMVSPGILTAAGELQPMGEWLSADQRPTDIGGLLNLLERLRRPAVVPGFVHPVIHRSDVLRTVGGYDPVFLRGPQGYEDDSLLLGYLYYMGRRSGWRPHCCLDSVVYHATMGQRLGLAGDQSDVATNLRGLVNQYGLYGLRDLAGLHRPGNAFTDLFAQSLAFWQKTAGARTEQS